MCGIIGYNGRKNCVPILLSGLEALEYRGYDSAGLALLGNDGLYEVKSCGRLSMLRGRINDIEERSGKRLCSHVGIGHTRWATHGAPSDKNAHPHSTERVSLVHNGIIENYAELEEYLSPLGYTFETETDTERALKLIDHIYSEVRDPVCALMRATEMMRGSFAFGVIFADAPESVFAIRRDSPLIVAMSDDGGLLASDVTAILPHTKKYYRLDEGTVAELRSDEIRFFGKNNVPVRPHSERIDWNAQEAERGGFEHFMQKEIFEIPDALRRTLSPRIKDGLPQLGVSLLASDSLSSIKRIFIVACGTAMHAGLIGRAVIERLARIPVNVEIASEFRYGDPILEKDDLVILLSQSGETADTLAALRHAKAQGTRTLAIVNVIGSSVAREADEVLYTHAGPEIAVASTKAYTVQCSLLYLIAVRLATARGLLSASDARSIVKELSEETPRAISEVLKMSDEIKKEAAYLCGHSHAFYIGRNIDRELCAEGSLKLKEISYIHSEAYAAGELKHGTISLIVDGTPVIALLTVSSVAEKTVSAIREVRSRGARVLAIVSDGIAKSIDIPADSMIVLPRVSELLCPFPASASLQLLAYHTAAQMGLDVDKPRNLAKSVTVE